MKHTFNIQFLFLLFFAFFQRYSNEKTIKMISRVLITVFIVIVVVARKGNRMMIREGQREDKGTSSQQKKTTLEKNKFCIFYFSHRKFLFVCFFLFYLFILIC